MKHLIRWVGDHADLDNPGDKQALMELAAAEVFIRLYFEWAFSPDHCGGPLFDAMLAAAEGVDDLAPPIPDMPPAPATPHICGGLCDELPPEPKPAPPDDCSCEWETAEGVNPTRTYTCPPCLSAQREEAVGDARREVDGG